MDAWCPACRTYVRIEDEHTESTYDGGSGGAHEYGYTVRDLACGHSVSTQPVEVGPAPGAPYAPGAAPDRRTAIHDRTYPPGAPE